MALEPKSPLAHLNSVSYKTIKLDDGENLWSKGTINEALKVKAESHTVDMVMVKVYFNPMPDSYSFKLAYRVDHKAHVESIDAHAEVFHNSNNLVKTIEFIIKRLCVEAKQNHNFPDELSDWMLEKAIQQVQNIMANDDISVSAGPFSVGGFIQEQKFIPQDASISEVSKRLPAMDTEVEFPKCTKPDCKGCAAVVKHKNENPTIVTQEGQRKKIWSIVQTLNDAHGWTREEIADWLELIADRDGIDITF